MTRNLMLSLTLLVLIASPCLALAQNPCFTQAHQQCYDDADYCYETCDYYTPGDCDRCFTELDECLYHTGDADVDCVDISVDNCPDDPNTSQADCDSDDIGDVCDDLNGTYEKTSHSSPCYVDVDDHVFYWTLELYRDAYYTDTSPCGSPDRTILELMDSATCSKTTSTWECCEIHFLGILGAGGCDFLLNQNRCEGEAT
jgi:hypothetical protein